MTTGLSEEVRSKTQDLAALLLNSSFWSSYQTAEQNMLSRDEIQHLMTELRKKQEARVKLGFRLLEHPKLDELDSELEDIFKRLEDFPEVQLFQELQSELGECLSGITRILGWSVEGLAIEWEVPGGKSACELPAQI